MQALTRWGSDQLPECDSPPGAFFTLTPDDLPTRDADQTRTR